VSDLSTRYKIFHYLLKGFAKAHIARILHVSPGTVQYHTDKLERDDYVYRVRGSKSPILYTEGRNGFKLKKKIDGILGREGDRGERLVVCASPPASVHHNGFKYNTFWHGFYFIYTM